MSSKLVEAARQGRNSGAVLKYELSLRRTSSPKEIFFVLEGIDDYGPYECWLEKLGINYEYSLLPGKGKSQLLDLRRRLANDKNNLRDGVYFIIDRDYDGLRGQSANTDVYLTDTYSVENSLVTEQVLRSVVMDEFQLAANLPVVEDIVARYFSVQNEFGCAMSDANFRIFYRSKLATAAGPLDKRIRQFVTAVSYTHLTLPTICSV